MYWQALAVAAALMLAGCAPEPEIVTPEMPRTRLVPSSFEALQAWDGESYGELLELFRENCTSGKARELYAGLCDEAGSDVDAEAFFERSFRPYRVVARDGDDTGLMTGYYEPLLHGSLRRDDRYRYPVYGQPDDLVTVDLSSVYPELKGKRLRGRLVGNRVLPYYTRAEMAQMQDAEAPVLCWVDDRVALFFLEVQGSGRIVLDTGDTMYIGYRNQNGHRYRSIGKYLIDRGEIDRDKMSLQAIRKWFVQHPHRVDEVLNYNASQVFFQLKSAPATGSLGLELTPGRSVAVDRRYIPLGSMLYVAADDPVNGEALDRVVFAQDTGGAIKGPLRADFFWGHGGVAKAKAGLMKAETEFWVFLPKNARQP